MTATGGADHALVDLIDTVSTAAAAVGSSHLAERLTVARARLERPTTYLCVVGEFKQGKSTLVNALIGQAVCPVDDDIATATVTVVSAADEPTITLVRVENGTTYREELPPAQLARWAVEGAEDDRPSGIERIEVGVPSALLSVGVTLIDTPGVGGLSAGTAAATLAFLPYADALMFATDASSELSAPEIALLTRARDLCPDIVICQTKADMHLDTDRIVAANREHLSTAGLAFEVLPISSAIRALAVARADAALNESSGFTPLLVWLGGIHAAVRASAARRAAAEVMSAIEELVEALQRERTATTSQEDEHAVLAELTTVQDRLAHLRGPAARWQTMLSDGQGDLSSQVTFQLRTRIRELLRSYDERAELLRNAQEWDDLGRALQEDVAAVIVEVFTSVERGAERLLEELRTLLQDERISGPRGDRPLLDARTLWSDHHVTGETAGESARARRWNTGLTVARSASSGMSMFSTITRLCAQATGALMMMSPIGIGFGLLFGATAVGDQRRRRVALLRQQARGVVRQYLDDVQFQSAEQLAEMLRGVHRTLRDETSQRLAELQQTTAAAQARIEAGRRDDQATRAQRRKDLDAQLAALQQWREMATRWQS